MKQVLYDYQADGLERTREAIRQLRAAQRAQRALLVAPTGAGKTTIASEMIHGAVARGGDVLFLAHRDELIQQCSRRLDGAGIEHETIIGKRGRAALWAKVRIASVQTLARRLDRLPRATLIVVDEAHHARAASYAAILDAYPGVPVVGLTATPWRLDNKGLGELFEDVVVVTTVRELIERGFLTPYTGFAYDVPDLSGVKKREGDFVAGELELAMTKSKIVGNIAEQWQLHCAGKRTILFAATIAHSQVMVDRFRALGVPAEHLDGSMPPIERAGVLARFASGDTLMVSNVNVLTEGFDLPSIEAVVLARPTLSLALYLQMVGRGLRTTCLACGHAASWLLPACPKCGSGAVKRICRIHDHAGCIARHGLPDADRDYALAFDPKKSGKKLPPLRTCKACFAVFAGSPARCPSCGEEIEQGGGGRSVEEVQGEQVRAVALEQLRQKVLVLNERLGERQEFYVSMLKRAEERGNKDGWAGYQFKNRYGVWPSKSMDPRAACERCNRRSFSVTVEAPVCSLCLAQELGAEVTCRRCGAAFVPDGYPRCAACRRSDKETELARRSERAPHVDGHGRSGGAA